MSAEPSSTRRRLRTTILTAVLGLTALVPAPPAAACSCAQISLEEALDASAAVFVGQVMRLEVIDRERGVAVIRADVEPLHVVRGRVPTTVQFLTDTGCCYCSFGFEIAERYLFFAYESEGQLVVDICTRTRRLRDAKEDLRALGLDELVPG